MWPRRLSHLSSAVFSLGRLWASISAQETGSREITLSLSATSTLGTVGLSDLQGKGVRNNSLGFSQFCVSSEPLLCARAREIRPSDSTPPQVWVSKRDLSLIISPQTSVTSASRGCWQNGLYVVRSLWELGKEKLAFLTMQFLVRSSLVSNARQVNFCGFFWIVVSSFVSLLLGQSPEAEHNCLTLSVVWFY